MPDDFGKYAAEVEAGLTADVMEREKPVLATVSALDLQKKVIPPIREIVPGLIVQGLTILGAPPKYGKSWMMLDLCLAVSLGSSFLGYRTRKTDCLYLALEDSERRLQQRMGKLLHSSAAPENFRYATVSMTTDTGLLDQLERFVSDYPGTGLVVIDTLQRVRGSSFGKDGSYSTDYREIGVLKGFADKHDLALVLVHHLRKAGDDADPFNRLSGTAAISGAADTMIVLGKEKRSSDTTRLNATGRDIEELELELRFDKERCCWMNLGNPEALAEQRAREEYEASPIVRTVKKLLAQAPDRQWSGTATQLLDAGTYIIRSQIASSARELSGKLRDLEGLLLEQDGIIHQRDSNGSGGGKHRFCYQMADADEEEVPFLRGDSVPLNRW